MKIAVITEGSTKFNNADVVRVLEELGHEVVNLGMKDIEGEPDLTYLETSFLSALVLQLEAVEFVVGGCGTGQGYMNAVLQYPGVACGLLTDPVEAWLFSQVNAGNCVSLQLNKGYGKVNGDINLRFMFEKLFNDTYGQGYPAVRGAIQKGARKKLEAISTATHYSMKEILNRMDRSVIENALAYPGVVEFLKQAPSSELKEEILKFTK